MIFGIVCSKFLNSRQRFEFVDNLLLRCCAIGNASGTSSLLLVCNSTICEQVVSNGLVLLKSAFAGFATYWHLPVNIILKNTGLGLKVAFCKVKLSGLLGESGQAA